MLQSPGNAVSLEGERGWKLSSTLFLVSLFFSSSSHLLTNSITFCPCHFFFVCFFIFLPSKLTYTGAPIQTHKLRCTRKVWTLLITHMQVNYTRRLKPRAAQPLSNTFASLAPIFSHFFILCVFSFCFLSLPHSTPPPSTASTYRSFLFLVKAYSPHGNIRVVDCQGAVRLIM